MALTTAAKAQVVQTFAQGKNDTGSPEVQVALLTVRINLLTNHLKTHNHDFHSRYGLTNMVSQRRRLLRYLKNKDSNRYTQIIKELDVRG